MIKRKKLKLGIFLSLFIVIYIAFGYGASITKGLIGEQDMNLWDGITSTFTRLTSTGGTITLNKVGYEVDALMVYGGGVNYTSTTIQSAITAINTIGNKVTLVLRPGTWTISAAVTFTSNITLKVVPGALLTYATGGSLTINGPFEAGLYQVFSGFTTGVTFGSGSVLSLSPVWWGINTTPGTTDMTIPIQSAITATPVGREVRFSSTIYAHTALTVTKGISLVGTGFGSSGTILKNIGIGTTGISFAPSGYSPGFRIFNMDIIGNGTGVDDATTGDGILITGSGRSTIERCRIMNHGGHGVKFVGHTYGTHIKECTIIYNHLDGIYGWGEPLAQINAINISSNIIDYNFRYGINIWGTNINIRENIIESNQIGINLNVTGMVTLNSSSYMINIRDNYFEANPFGHIYGKVEYVASPATVHYILGLLIEGNYFYESAADADPTLTAMVKFEMANANSGSGLREAKLGLNYYYTDSPTLGYVDFGQAWGVGNTVELYSTPATFSVRWLNLIRNPSYANSNPLVINNLNRIETFTAADATPSVAGSHLFQTANIAPTTITMFDNGMTGQNIKVLIQDAFTTIDFTGTYLKGNGNVDWTPTTLDWMECTFDGTYWRCSVHESSGLNGTLVWNPGSLADGVGETSGDIAVTGAALGNFVSVAAPYDLQGITCNAYVQAADVVRIRLQNETTGTIDLASGTWKVRVIK